MKAEFTKDENGTVSLPFPFLIYFQIWFVYVSEIGVR